MPRREDVRPHQAVAALAQEGWGRPEKVPMLVLKTVHYDDLPLLVRVSEIHDVASNLI